MKTIRLIVFFWGLALPGLIFGDVVQIDAFRDTGIIQQIPDNNMGAHTHVTVGESNDFSVRRALFYMDIASFIPAGATINSVAFEFDVTRQGGPQGQQGALLELFRLTNDWTEGTGVGSVGTPTGDGATWVSRNGVDLWTTPGGDLAGVASGSVFVDWPADGGGTITYSLGNAQLIDDVQNMLDNPGSNFGFELKAFDENLPGSAMRITSREDGNPLNGSEARLVVNFTVVPEPGSAVVLSLFCLIGAQCAFRKRRTAS